MIYPAQKTLTCEAVVRESLCIDNNVEIDRSKPLKQLCDVWPIDIADIFFKLQVPFGMYTSGQTISKQGAERIGDIAEQKYHSQRDEYFHLRELACAESTGAFCNMVTLRDIEDIAEYENLNVPR